MKSKIVTLIVIVLGLILSAIRSAHEPWTAMRTMPGCCGAGNVTLNLFT